MAASAVTGRRDDELRRRDDKLKWRSYELRRRVEKTTRRDDKLRRGDDELTRRVERTTRLDDKLTWKEDELRRRYSELRRRYVELTRRDDKLKWRTTRWTFCPRFDVIPAKADVVAAVACLRRKIMSQRQATAGNASTFASYVSDDNPGIMDLLFPRWASVIIMAIMVK